LKTLEGQARIKKEENKKKKAKNIIDNKLNAC
jgi:hypothetical protein